MPTSLRLDTVYRTSKAISCRISETPTSGLGAMEQAVLLFFLTSPSLFTGRLLSVLMWCVYSDVVLSPFPKPGRLRPRFLCGCMPILFTHQQYCGFSPQSIISPPLSLCLSTGKGEASRPINHRQFVRLVDSLESSSS